MMKNNPKNKIYPAALTIAGSDSGGGAGIQADLRTFNAFGVYGCTAITAVTSQNPKRVTRIDALPAEGVVSQIDTVLEAVAIRHAKSGMLFSAEIVSAVADAVKRHRIPLVVDPVMVSTSGSVLLENSAIEALKRELLPLAEWITRISRRRSCCSAANSAAGATISMPRASATRDGERQSCSRAGMLRRGSSRMMSSAARGSSTGFARAGCRSTAVLTERAVRFPRL